MKIKEAFTFTFKDEKWISKILIGTALLFTIFAITLITRLILVVGTGGTIDQKIALLEANAISFLISSPFYIFMFGYMLELVHNLINEKTPALPEWFVDVKKYLINGLKGYVIIFTYTIIFFLICLISSIILLATKISIIAIFAIIIVFSIAFTPLLIVAYSAFAEDFNFKKAFAIKRNLKIFGKTWLNYIGIIALALIIFIPLLILLCISCVGIILLPTALFLMKLIANHFYAQIYKKAIGTLSV